MKFNTKITKVTKANTKDLLQRTRAQCDSLKDLFRASFVVFVPFVFVVVVEQRDR